MLGQIVDVNYKLCSMVDNIYGYKDDKMEDDDDEVVGNVELALPQLHKFFNLEKGININNALN